MSSCFMSEVTDQKGQGFRPGPSQLKGKVDTNGCQERLSGHHQGSGATGLDGRNDERWASQVQEP